MRIFISAGEPSGDLHGGNLVRALRQADPSVECVGFGGACMEAAGCRLLYPLAGLAVMGVLRVLQSAHKFLALLLEADRYFRLHKPDAVVLIDYPGFHWWLARRAHAHGVPVFYFVPPQIWAWAGWRVRKMRAWVDHVLCSLPFEEAWYRERGVPAHYLGHPYFDELAQQRLDRAFVEQERARSGTIIGLLPGSRTQEVVHNLPTLVRAAGHIHAQRPETRFLVACYKPHHLGHVRRYLAAHGASHVEPCTGRTPEVIDLAKACISVSGSVGLELLYRTKPSVVVYRTDSLTVRVIPFFNNSRFISLVNLLAEQELFPEYLTDRCEAEAVSGHVVRWLGDEKAYGETVGALERLRSRVAEPGACRRVARYILAALQQRAPARRNQVAA
jgi:lipid-A-disaccharide synthase